MNPLNNQSQPDNTNNNSTNPPNPQNPQMKMPMMGIPVIFSPFLYNTQDQTPVGEKCKIWVGKIPEGISETFIKKLLECCGQIASWHRTTNSSGKLNSFGFCEYSTVESILKCLRLLNGYPLGNSELQIKIGKDTEEYLKKWRERKKIEWINSLTMQGIPVNLEEIKKKEENGEPLEWELKLVSNDQEILKTINEVVSQRQAIDSSGKPISIEKDIFFKNLTDIASSNILENAREKERKRKKEEKKKKFEKLFQDFEKNWIKHENSREKKRKKAQLDKENWPKKRQKLIEKDLEYDSDQEKKYNEGLKGIGNKGYKISTSFINKKKNEERIRMREKEKEYDNALREKENKMLFKDNYLQLNENKLNNLLENKEILAIAQEEKKPQTTLQIEDYDPNSINQINISEEKSNKNVNDNIKPKAEFEKNIDINLNMNIEKEEKDINNENEGINVDKMTLEQLMSGIPQNDIEGIKKNVKESIPKNLDELFKYKINWDIITKYELKRKKIKKYIEECLLKYFDEVDSFTKFILEKLGALSPYELQNKLKYVLEENTEVSIYNHLI
jgi:RNA-binding protein 25